MLLLSGVLKHLGSWEIGEEPTVPWLPSAWVPTVPGLSWTSLAAHSLLSCGEAVPDLCQHYLCHAHYLWSTWLWCQNVLLRILTHTYIWAERDTSYFSNPELLESAFVPTKIFPLFFLPPSLMSIRTESGAETLHSPRLAGLNGPGPCSLSTPPFCRHHFIHKRHTEEMDFIPPLYSAHKLQSSQTKAFWFSLWLNVGNVVCTFQKGHIVYFIYESKEERKTLFGSKCKNWGR